MGQKGVSYPADKNTKQGGGKMDTKTHLFDNTTVRLRE